MKKPVTLLVVVIIAGVGLGGALAGILTFGREFISLRSRIPSLAAGEAKDIEMARQWRATAESAEYVDEHMAAAPNFLDKFKLLEASLQEVDPGLKGLYCEFGVYKGTTINFIATLVKEEVHGFDSFEGLPENWRGGFGKGTFKLEALPAVRANVKLHKGWFSDSLPTFRQQHKEKLAFMHMDADLYSSTKDVFSILADRLVPGTVIQFDEFFNYPGWRTGEYRAFRELCETRHAEVKYIGYCGTNEQVALKIIKIDPPVH